MMSYGTLEIRAGKALPSAAVRRLAERLSEAWPEEASSDRLDWLVLFGNTLPREAVEQARGDARRILVIEETPPARIPLCDIYVHIRTDAPPPVHDPKTIVLFGEDCSFTHPGPGEHEAKDEIAEPSPADLGRLIRLMRLLDQEPFPFDALHLRQAERADMPSLFHLVSDPTSRRWAVVPEPFSFETHRRWLDERLGDPACRLWLLFWEEMLIGAIRYQRSEEALDEALISIQIASPFRGKGLGTWLLQHAAPRAGQELEVGRLRAILRWQNLPSSRCFIKAGFTRDAKNCTDEKDCYVLELG